MFRVYIVDDEFIVRQGLKTIIDWQQLGFEICGEAGDGLTALNEIMELGPDLVLADIRMPKLSGLDLAQKLRSKGFEGRIIVLSGYSEFEYAQEAISYNVDYYLTKPISQDELKDAAVAIYSKLQENKLQSQHTSYYQEKAKFKILEEILKRKNTGMQMADSTLKELALEAEEYQVLILEKLNLAYDAYADFCAILRISTESSHLERHVEGQREILLLKGSPLITKFAEYRQNHTGIKDKSFIIMVGKPVVDFQEIYSSYQEAEHVRSRNFFSKTKKFVVDTTDVAELPGPSELITLEDSSEIGTSLYECIIVYKQFECERLLATLAENLTRTKSEIKAIKNFLAGMLIYIIQEFKKDYANYDVPFETNAEIIRIIESQTYLTDIIDYIEREVRRMIESISKSSSDGILEAVLNFIHHHYHEDIKLKTLAQKFGYNSSYLGKIFSEKYKVNFNDYLHQVRIEKAMELLRSENYKVYEVAELVGYSNVDYFHVKFREYAGTTPTKYKKGESPL